MIIITVFEITILIVLLVAIVGILIMVTRTTLDAMFKVAEIIIIAELVIGFLSILIIFIVW